MVERSAILVAVLLVATACAKGGAVSGDAARILALGDSYTIGESVTPEERWPSQLADRLQAEGIPVSVEIVARTGWTTDELDAGIDAAVPEGPYDLVTLLVGVNNQYRGMPLDEYRADLAALLARAIEFAGEPSRVIVISIPDWGVTPFAEARGAGPVSGQIDAFNAVNREEAGRADAVWVDVTDISRSGSVEMVAPDGLHPSGRQYELWTERILPVARRILTG